jgi:hypothetical protein
MRASCLSTVGQLQSSFEVLVQACEACFFATAAFALKAARHMYLQDAAQQAV